MLDTSMLIYLIKHRPASVAARVDALDADDTLCMSFVTFAELLLGAERSDRPSQVLRRIDEVTRIVPVVHATDRSLCVHYARHAARLRAAGTPIGANDLWIACHALAEDATLVTNNMREFARIEGLRTENWVA